MTMSSQGYTECACCCAVTLPTKKAVRSKECSHRVITSTPFCHITVEAGSEK